MGDDLDVEFEVIEKEVNVDEEIVQDKGYGCVCFLCVIR